MTVTLRQSASVLHSGLICQGSGYLVSGSIHPLDGNDRHDIIWSNLTNA